MYVVYFHTLLNGWITSRRMRTANNMRRDQVPPCVLCNSGEDSLTHMSRCNEVHLIFKKFGAPINSLEQFLSLDMAAQDNCILLKRVKALSVVYSIYNTVKHHPAHLPPLSLPFLLTAAYSNG